MSDLDIDLTPGGTEFTGNAFSAIFVDGILSVDYAGNSKANFELELVGLSVLAGEDFGQAGQMSRCSLICAEGQDGRAPPMYRLALEPARAGNGDL